MSTFSFLLQKSPAKLSDFYRKPRVFNDKIQYSVQEKKSGNILAIPSPESDK